MTDFRLKQQNQNYDNIVEQFAEYKFARGHIESRNQKINESNKNNASDKMYGSGLSEKLDEVVNDQGYRKNIQNIIPLKRRNKLQCVFAE